MVHVKRKLCLVIWKCLILRKRNWLLTVLELVAPILILYLAFRIIMQAHGPKTKDSRHINLFEESIFFGFSLFSIGYAPTNDYNDHIMKLFTNYSFLYMSRQNYTTRTIEIAAANKSEEDLVLWMEYQSDLITNHSNKPTYRNIDQPVGVVFLEANSSSKTLKYKIRTDPKFMLDLSSQDNRFLGIQVRLDLAFLKTIDQNFQSPEIYLNDFPFSYDLAIFTIIYFFMIIAYLFLVVSVLREVIQEKASGIKELMKIMGLSSWMVWTHWFIYTLMVHIPVTVIIIIMLSLFDPPPITASLFIVWLLFFTFTINCIILLFVLSCLFNKTVMGTTICVCGWLIIHSFLMVTKYRKYGFYMQVLFCLIPLNNLVKAMESIDSFYYTGVSWTIGEHMFAEGSASSQISVGLSIIISILETFVLIFLLTFLDAVKPGPYGVGKPVTFLCQWCKSLTKHSSESVSQNSSYVKTSLPKRFEPPPQGAKVGIEVRGLHKRFGTFNKAVAVDNVDLDIYEGEIMALLGHNGAGKTTTMSILTGMISPTRGTVQVDGRDIHGEQSTYRDSLGLCTQHNLCFPKLTVMEHLLFFGMLKGMPYSEVKRKGIELLDLLKITHKKNSVVSELSGGMKRRLCFSVALIGNPKVLILDEPTSGLDPESRRKIWNIILSMRGQRTVLITTHFMEEADVLGDRIAIMDHGHIVCCGTSMFLKKLYGTGYHLHILKDQNSSTQDISSLVKQNVPNPQTKIVSPSQIDFVLKEDSVLKFPNLFLALERNSSNLGITGISVTCTTMEDVFLKVAEISSDEDPTEKKSISKQTSSTLDLNDSTNIKGTVLVCQRLEALFFKCWSYRRRSFYSFLITYFISLLLIFVMSRNSIEIKKELPPQPSLDLNVDLYPDYMNLVLHDEEGKIPANIAANLIKKQKGKVTILPNARDIDSYMEHLQQSAYSKFSKTLLGLEFTKGNVTVLYQIKLPHAPSIAANLITNILLQNFTNDSSASIELISHPLPRTTYTLDCTGKHSDTLSFGLSWNFFITSALTFLMLNFIPFHTKERVTGFKHQQLLAGVSPLLFWAVNFLFDYCIYICCIVLYILIIVFLGGVDLELGMIGLLIFSLLLHGLTGLFFLYFYTYLMNSSNLSVPMYLVCNIIFTILPVFIYRMESQLSTTSLIIFCLFSLNPLFDVIYVITGITKWIVHSEYCKHCESSTGCDNIAETLLSTDFGGILIHLILLATLWIFYLGMILLLDYGVVKRICLILFYKQSTQSNGEDKDVTKEMEQVRSVKESGDESYPLIAENLIKKYFCGPRAVNGVTFLVAPGECFGLLGVNGAGKSTTFKMLTAEIFPNSGDANTLKYSVISNTRKYLSCVGYCPQFDAFLDALTGEETLKIIAKLRGIPRNEVTEEVANWLTNMGISEHAKKPSGVYSGGTKRKLSTAMAFIGNPVVVFLDEPTTGVDPVSRRKLWSVVQARQRVGQAIVLTSHSMEECEVLCSRLTIMKDGQMKCIGTSEYLKNKFSQGYTVLVKLINSTPPDLEKLKEEFSQIFPACEIKDEHMTLIHYQIADPSIHLSKLFSEMLTLKNKHSIVEDFSVSNMTLEQLFMSFVKKKKKAK